MGKVKVDISMSVDGFIAGPSAGRELPLGERGEELHEWGIKLESWRRQHGQSGGETGPDSELLGEAFASLGALIMGKRMFAGTDGPWEEPAWEGWWGDEPPFGVPVYVLTHHPREELVKGQTTFHFVTEGADAALELARVSAGDRDIAIAGGANTIQQLLRAGRVDELQLHVVPILLGDGTRLFEGHGDGTLELERVVDSPTVTHLRYRVAR